MQGNLRFMTEEARDDFARLVLHGIRPTQKVIDLAARVADRMTQRNEGRLWMGAHMRRGDCEEIQSLLTTNTDRIAVVRLGWAIETTPTAHLARVKRQLREGRILLQRLNKDNIMTYNVPDVEVDETVLQREAPQENYQCVQQSFP